MKSVSFCEGIGMYQPVMQGHMYLIRKEPLCTEEDIAQRHSPFQRLSRQARSTFHGVARH